MMLQHCIPALFKPLKGPHQYLINFQDLLHAQEPKYNTEGKEKDKEVY